MSSNGDLDKPLRVDWVDFGSVPGLSDAKGKLGMTLLPGRQGSGGSGVHRRDLTVDAASLRDVHHADAMLLLVEDYELEREKVRDIVEVAKEHGVEVIRHPVADMGVPLDPDDYSRTLDELRQRVAEGDSIVVACVGGLGRTGTAVACMLIDAGLDAEDAIGLTRASRRKTIESAAQEEFVRRWATRRRGQSAADHKRSASRAAFLGPDPTAKDVKGFVDFLKGDAD